MSSPSTSPMQEAIEFLITTAQSQNVELEVLAVERANTGISFQARKMDQFSFSETHQLGVRVLDGRHEGVAYTESLDRDSLEDTLSEARSNARMIQREWISDLTTARELPQLAGIFNAGLESVNVQDKIQAAQLLESAALEFNPAITAVAYTRYGDGSATSWIANTKGLWGHYRKNYCMGYTYCLAKDGDNSVMDGEAVMAQDFAKFDPKAIAQTAAERTLARRGAVRPKTGKYTVVFENRAAEDLLGTITGYFSAKEIDENTSPLKGKMGQQVFSKHLSLLDDPTFTSATACRPFDDEGFASQKTTLVDNGVLKSYMTNSVLARKLGLPHTAGAVRSPSTDLDASTTNLLVRPGSQTLHDLLKVDQKVIFITDLKGKAGFRHTSGDFSIPMEGFLYENGQRVVALKDFLVSGNILTLLAGIEGVANDVQTPVGNVVSPSLMIPEVSVSGEA